MTRRATAALFLAIIAVFIVMNRQAYQGYFQDDDINNISWTRWGSVVPYLKGTITPVYAHSFRAMGFLYYRECEQVFGLNFAGYVAVLQAFSLLNTCLLWAVMRRLGISGWAACAGCGFFALHMALFDAFWRPAYIFDVLCASFCLISVLFWIRGNWILSFLAFWLAYKSKEPAVMLPLVLVLYEALFGGRRWWRLAPFLAASCAFALQALVWKPDEAGGYIYDFSANTLATTVPFYVQRIFLVPCLGFLLLLSPLIFRNRKALFGLGAMALFFIPLIFLPGRLFSVYCYLPFTGLAILWGGISETVGPVPMAVFFLFWMPLDIETLRVQQAEALRQGSEARVWMDGVARFIRSRPEVEKFVYEGMPEGFRPFGIEGAVKYFKHRVSETVPRADSPWGIEDLKSGGTAILQWDASAWRLTIKSP